MTPKETADLLRVSARTLERWRAEGKGPAFIRPADGTRVVLYAKSDVLTWIKKGRTTNE